MKSGWFRAALGLAVLLAAVAPNVVHAQHSDDSEGLSAGEAAGLAAAAVTLPPGHRPVFLIPYLKSHSGTPDPSATVISLTNVNGVTACPTSVAWNIGFGGTSCVTTLNLAGGGVVGDTGEHCSRGVPGDVATCNATCVPPLNFIEGKAIVGTTLACINRIAVDARLYHLQVNDGPATAIADLKAVRLPLGNKGD